ncbi:spore germination protein GerW family protein [Methanosphaera sp.]|uniref:GerW family sporulation protein n=1 Tax=Methanosphaera sp. TaxID=2666342 RepID=UPI0025F452B1|nr:spore germination protein GerW family protein [Methanosphaera sp.]MEE1117246.1 spore germination protein GerW family protein [Methanosphaera sp.]MEE3324018.1 spore germination protein GerW family protein [Methanosphaera sp.]MEE3418134.1 spore germination protein GerW family protein [Methanosphaera sp.]
MNLDNSIEKTLNEIQKVMNTNSIVGTPIDADDKLIIPISKTSLGFGVGVADNKGTNETGIGGTGGGGSIDPVALLIVYKNIPGPNGVELVQINKDDSLEGLLSGVSKVVMGVLNNAKETPATELPSESSIDKIKTKIKKESG